MGQPPRSRKFGTPSTGINGGDGGSGALPDPIDEVILNQVNQKIDNIRIPGKSRYKSTYPLDLPRFRNIDGDSALRQ